MAKVKICGITNREDALRSCEYGADYLGFIFIEGTPRAVAPADVKEMVKDFSEKAELVGLFLDETPEKVAEVSMDCGLQHVQLHGSESPDYCRRLKELWGRHGYECGIMKALKVSDKILGPPLEEYVHADHFVFDTFHPDLRGGTGAAFNWDVLREVRDFILKPFFIAGGLNPANVADAVKAVRPYGVDVSSGVEKERGRKDETLLKEFIENAKKIEVA